MKKIILTEKQARKLVQLMNEGMEKPYASAAVFLFAKNETDEWCILCGKRAGNDSRFNGGEFDVPCGCKEPNENPKQTAVRETFEETGIEINPNDIQYVEKHPWGDSEGNYGMNFYCICDECLPIKRGDDEHDFFKWLPIKQISSLKWAFNMDEKIMKYFKMFVENNK